MPIVVLRPNADGHYSQLKIFPTSPTTHYDKVNEETADEDSSFVYDDGSVLLPKETFRFNDGLIPDGATINKIALFARARKTGVNTADFKFLLKQGANENESTSFDLTQNYLTYVRDYTVNPWTSNPWTKSDFDSNFSAGVRTNADINSYVRVTQVFLVITITFPTPPVTEVDSRGNIIKGEYTSSIAIGDSALIPIYLGTRESHIKGIQISAPGLNKTSDVLNVYIYSMKDVDVADDIDLIDFWEGVSSDSHPGGNYMFIKTSLKVMYEDDETEPFEGSPHRWLWMKVENDGSNSGSTTLKYRIIKGSVH